MSVPNTISAVTYDRDAIQMDCEYLVTALMIEEGVGLTVMMRQLYHLFESEGRLKLADLERRSRDQLASDVGRLHLNEPLRFLVPKHRIDAFQMEKYSMREIIHTKLLLDISLEMERIITLNQQLCHC